MADKKELAAKQRLEAEQAKNKAKAEIVAKKKQSSQPLRQKQRPPPLQKMLKAKPLKLPQLNNDSKSERTEGASRLMFWCSLFFIGYK